VLSAFGIPSEGDLVDLARVKARRNPGGGPSVRLRPFQFSLQLGLELRDPIESASAFRRAPASSTVPDTTTVRGPLPRRKDGGKPCGRSCRGWGPAAYLLPAVARLGFRPCVEALARGEGALADTLGILAREAASTQNPNVQLAQGWGRLLLDGRLTAVRVPAQAQG